MARWRCGSYARRHMSAKRPSLDRRPKTRLGRALFASSVLAALLVLASSVSASAARTIKAEPAHYWAVTYLGGWHVRAHPGYGKAVFALGEPSSVSSDGVPCTAYWNRLGLRILSTSFGGVTSCGEASAQRAVVKGPAGRRAWRTQRGLRVGDRFARLRRLYPNARRKPGARVVVYQEDPFIGDGSIITALIRHRRVASLQLWLGGAGD
jgi:hypothetical protein